MSSGLTGCATRSSQVDKPAPRAADPRVCAKVEDEPPVEGTIPVAETSAERRGLDLFLNGEAEARAWGRRGWDRVALALTNSCLTVN